MSSPKLRAATAVIRDLIGTDCAAVAADVDAAIDHAELYYFVVQKICL